MYDGVQASKADNKIILCRNDSDQQSGWCGCLSKRVEGLGAMKGVRSELVIVGFSVRRRTASDVFDYKKRVVDVSTVHEVM